MVSLNHPLHWRAPALAAFWAVALAIAPAAMLAAAAPDLTGVQVEKDVPYLGASAAEKLDLYRPEKLDPGRRYPAIVIIHGGGWTGGSKGDAREQNFATTLVLAGYICVSIDYTLATPQRSTWPQNLYQCKSAVQFLRQNARRYQIDPKHIGVMGGSAGGHLSLMVGLTSVTGSFAPPGPYGHVSSRVQAVADFYGPSDLATVFPDPCCETMFGVKWTEKPALWEQASPINYVTRRAPPVLVIHGTEDATVPISQSELLLKKLEAEGVPHQYLRVSGAGHSFDLQPPQQDLRAAVIAFFDKYLQAHL
jgi:acetyl esterase/lipase